jgi:HPt (histidine-containing phosphotransfer) domain-containing protein
MGLETAAHSLKSSSSYVGAAELSAICRDLEEIGRSGRLDGAAEKAGQIKAEYERVKAALDEEIRG